MLIEPFLSCFLISVHPVSSLPEKLINTDVLKVSPSHFLLSKSMPLEGYFFLHRRYSKTNKKKALRSQLKSRQKRFRGKGIQISKFHGANEKLACGAAKPMLHNPCADRLQNRDCLALPTQQSSHATHPRPTKKVYVYIHDVCV